jgi:hypothetical protein
MRTKILFGCWLGLVGCTSGINPNLSHTGVTPRSASGQTAAPLAGVGFYAGCMATVVDTRRALTAAHCVQNSLPGAHLLLLGSDINLPKYRLPVLSIVPHPQFNPTTRAFDVALLNLGVDAGVPPLPVLDRLPDDLSGQVLQVAGYGASGSGTRGVSGALQGLGGPVSAVDAQTVHWDNDGTHCFGDTAAPLIYADLAGNLLLAALASSTSAGDCSGETLGTRLDVVAGDFNLPTAPPAQTSPTPSAPSRPAGDCGSLTERGQCMGDRLLYCDSSQLSAVQDCSATGAHCVWSYADQHFACGAAPDSAGQAACAGASFAGRCIDTLSVWCQNGNRLVQDDCAAVHKLCGYNAALGYYDCLAPGTSGR